MQESHDQRAEQKRRVSELVNLSEIVPCAKGQMSMQNNQLSHTRWDRDQLFRNCFSNPFQRPRKAPSAKWKYCAQCSWLERKSDCVQNKWKPKRGFSDKLTDDHIWRFVTFFLCEKHQRFVVRPNEAWRKETLLPSVSVKHHNKRNPAKARRGQRGKGINSRPMRTEMPKQDENHVFFRNVGNQSTLHYLCRLRGNHAARGYKYKLVKSNGEATEIKLYHRENALEEFLKLLFQEEERIREELRKVVPIKMIGKISTLQPIDTSVKSLRWLSPFWIPHLFTIPTRRSTASRHTKGAISKTN